MPRCPRWRDHQYQTYSFRAEKRQQENQQTSSRLMHISKARPALFAGRMLPQENVSTDITTLPEVSTHDSLAICPACRSNAQETILAIQWMKRGVEKRLRAVQEVCASCSGTPHAEPIECESLECGWFFERSKVWREWNAIDGPGLSELIRNLEL